MMVDVVRHSWGYLLALVDLSTTCLHCSNVPRVLHRPSVLPAPSREDPTLHSNELRRSLPAAQALQSTAMDFDWTPEQIALRAHARKVATEAVERYGRHNDSWINGFSKDFAKEMAAHGWIGMTWPTEFGGGGRPAIDRLIVGEELIAAGAPIAAMWFADRQMGPTLIHYGTADQQAEFLPGMLSGETTWCIGMSEPDSGSRPGLAHHHARSATATTSSSTARRSGRASANWPTTAT